MPLQDRFLFKLGFILTAIITLFILANSHQSFAGDDTEYYPEDIRKIRILAEQGDAEAQCNLGIMYYNGEGVPQDYKDAVKWCRKAAEQGLAEAQSNLGTMYANGEGVPQDYKEAVKWFRKAAEQGYAGAQYNLGNMYVNGDGVPQNYKKAYAWLNLAALQGYAKAVNRRDYFVRRFMFGDIACLYR